MTRQLRGLQVGLLLLALILVPVGVVAVHDMRSGTAANVVPVGLSPGHVAVDTRMGRAFVANYGGNSLSILDTRSGAVLRTVPVGAAPTGVVVNDRTRRAFVLNDIGSVSVVDAATGFVLRTVQLPMVGAVAEDEGTGHIFVAGGCGGMPGTVAMLDARTGMVLRIVTIGTTIPQEMAVDVRTHRAFVTNPWDGSVSVLDTATGRLARMVAVHGNPTGVAVDERTGRAFVTNSLANTVSVLDARSGGVLRTVAVGAEPTSLAVDTQTGRVFIVNATSGTVSVLDARTGAVRRTVAVGAARPQSVDSANPPDVVVDERGGHVFVLNGGGFDRQGIPTNGSVSVLDARSGRVLRRVAVGLSPLAVAVDQTTAHLFVANQVPEVARGQSVWGRMLAGVQQRLPWLPHASPSPRTGSVTVIDTTRL